jgi:cell division control protein 6
VSDDLQDMFTEYLEKESVFQDKDLLTTKYKPDDILHREEQINELASIMAPALKGNDPSNLFIYGTVGTGKTLCVRHVCDNLQEASADSPNELKIIYINCKMKKVADTEYRLSAELARELGEDVPSTGLPTDEVYDRFFTALEEQEDVVVIVLDEIDALVKKIGDSFLYNLTRINDDLEGTKVSIVGISNDLNFTDYMDSRVKSSLSEEEIIFPPYNALELRNILEQRTEQAFTDGVLVEGVIPKCAALAAQEHGDARRALDLIRVAGELAERKQEDAMVSIDAVDQAQDKIEKDRLKETIRSQPKQSKLLIYTIFTEHQDKGGKMATGDIYSKYKEQANRAGMKTLTQRRISDLISELDMLGVINAKVISKGRYGRTREISVDLSDQAVEDIQDMLEENFYM